MKFSMNGFRRQLSADTETLRDVADRTIKGEWVDDDELAEAVNAIITHSNVVNCVYIEGDQEFTDISHLEVDHLETSQ